MPEEWFDLVSLFWSDEVILNGRKADGTIVTQYLTRNQIAEVHSLEAAHDLEKQSLLRRFVGD